MTIIKDDEGLILGIKSRKKKKIIIRTDDIMRDVFHTLLEIEKRCFVLSEGNVSPHIFTYYTPISEIQKESIEEVEKKGISWMEMDSIFRDSFSEHTI